jgi:hypothetical protein
MPRKQKQKQRQSQKQVVNINLGKASGKAKRKYTRRQPARVQQAQPIYNFTPQPYQLTPQVFMTPQPKQELEIPSLGSQQPKKNTVGEIKMNIPEPPKPKLEQYTEPPLSEYTKPAPKPPSNIISERPKLSGLPEAITAQQEKMLKFKQDPISFPFDEYGVPDISSMFSGSLPQRGFFPKEPKPPIIPVPPKRRPPQKIIGEMVEDVRGGSQKVIGEKRQQKKTKERLLMGLEDPKVIRFY